MNVVTIKLLVIKSLFVQILIPIHHRCILAAMLAALFLVLFVRHLCIVWASSAQHLGDKRTLVG